MQSSRVPTALLLLRSVGEQSGRAVASCLGTAECLSAVAAPKLIGSIKRSAFGPEIPNLSNHLFPIFKVGGLSNEFIRAHLGGRFSLSRVLGATQNDDGY